jgi:metal-responsive CopG/Arc/MetJ family transcriptional regulator
MTHGEQITLRIPRDLARELARRAKALRVPKSQLVREAVSRYLAEPAAPAPGETWERIKHLVGILDVDYEDIKDPIARQIYRNNWRE